MLYRERNDNCRMGYLKNIADVPKEKRVYIDETGFNTPLIREYAYGPIGERVMGERTGKRFARTSLIGGWREGKAIAPMEFTGYCDTGLVLSWAEEILVPELQPGDVIILDNASFHKSLELESIIEEAGCTLLFLPPYSPDLNPIEQFWSTLKSWIRALNDPFLHISKALTKVFSYLHT